MDTESFKRLLKERGVSQTQLAQWLGRDKAVVTNLLKGRRQLKAEEAVRIAQRIGIPVHMLLSEVGMAGEAAPVPIAGGLGEPALIPFQHAPVRVKESSQVICRDGHYFIEEGSCFGPKAYALEVRDNSLNMLGVLPGDVVISALDTVVSQGKIAIVQYYEGDSATTILRRYDPPLLTAHSTNASHRHYTLESAEIRVVSPVLKLIRLL